jgi:hypothetical protein
MVIELEFSEFNKVGNVIIPEDIINQAIEATLPNDFLRNADS